jgi:hypothetical protein
MQYRIRENSFVAKIAAKKLRCRQVALVLGKTIHLYNTTREEFLANPEWLMHELEHVRQFRQYGFAGFIVRYLVETLRKGYWNNRFEVEARAAERLPVNRSATALVQS